MAPVRLFVFVLLALVVVGASCTSQQPRDVDDDDGRGSSATSTSAATGGGPGGDPATGSGGVGGTSSATGGGGSGPSGAVYLGRSCNADADCGPLSCVLPSDPALGGRGPQGGLCSALCIDNEGCAQISADALCLSISGIGHCVQTCQTGSGVPKASKCRGRDDMACASVSAPDGTSGGDACLPTCSSDAACGAGRYCNHGTGLCQDNPLTGDPIGAPCDPQAANNSCVGGYCSCSNVGCTEGQCGGLCSLGSTLDGCGGPQGTGGCLLVLEANPGDGDLGVCAAACNCTADCEHPSFACNELAPGVGLPGGEVGFCFTAGTFTLDVCCSCANKTCGSDGCGQSCGSCSSGDACVGGQCCATQCAGKSCGPDGCGGSCGTCPASSICTAQGQCECVPDCTGNVCGTDGCGGTCGSCATGDVCTSGSCCSPSCSGNECGSDGCGGTCGSCPANHICALGQCECQPNCSGLSCGADGCGGTCGACSPSENCSSGTCCPNYCSFDSTCAAAGCAKEYCNIVTNSCVTCKPNSHYCATNAECCTGLCDTQVGVCWDCVSDFVSCSQHSDCCSGNCGANGYCI